MDCAGGRWMMFTRSTPPSTNPSQNGTRRPATAGQSSFAPSAGPCPGAGSPAESAGILAGDVLVALNGVSLNKDNDEALMKARKEWKPGQTVTYTIKRSGGERQVTLTLGSWPADALAKMIGMHMLEHANSESVPSK